MTTEERLEKMERELSAAKRRNRWILLVITLAATGAYALGCNVEQRIISAQHFHLVDESGKTRALLTVCADGPGLLMKDENGKTRLLLTVDNNGPRLFMFDENAKPVWSAP